MSSPLARLLLALYRMPATTQRIAEACLDAAVLGLASDELLQKLTQTHYERRSLFRGEEHNSRGLFEWERLALEKHFPSDGRLLVTSAGGGREAIALVEAGGYQVVATECVAPLAEGLRRRLEPATRNGLAEVIISPPEEVPRSETFDAAIIGWGAYSHLIGCDVRTKLLRNLHDVLRPRAPLLLSYLGTSGSGRLRDGSRLVASALRRMSGRRAIEPGERIGQIGYHRLFQRLEVEQEVSTTGFAPVEHRDEPYPHLIAIRSEESPS